MKAPISQEPGDWMALPFSVRDGVFHAILDPGAVVGYRLEASDGALETAAHWQARAAIEAMRLAGWRYVGEGRAA